jgi:hypothetical protein
VLAELFALLAPYQPTLVGTFPLGLQVEGSDLDIVCFAEDLDRFERDLLAALPGAAITRTPEATVATLVVGGIACEIFAQPIPVTAQNGFRHMIIEGRLLVLGGAPLRAIVLAHKRAGLKTEPAFALALGLDGDPYAALLALEGADDARLRDLIIRGRLAPP